GGVGDQRPGGGGSGGAGLCYRGGCGLRRTNDQADIRGSGEERLSFVAYRHPVSRNTPSTISTAPTTTRQPTLPAAPGKRSASRSTKSGATPASGVTTLTSPRPSAIRNKSTPVFSQAPAPAK